MQPFIEQPQFLLEPQSSYLIEHQSIRLECRAIRTRQIFFNCENKWLNEDEHHKSTTVNEKGQIVRITSIELKSEKIDSNQHYKCFCQAWSATGGMVKSRLATIEIAYLEKIFDWEPLRTDSVMGKSVELRCRPPMGHPMPQVTWFKDNQAVEINRNGRLILSNENSLLIASVEKNDAGNYTCVASNLAGSYSSEPAELLVHDDRGWSEWQSFSECKGIPCSSGRQRRIRTCLNPPTINNRPSCEGEAIEERECPLPCHKEENDDFTVWTSWSNCTGDPCQMGHQTRQRTCLKTSLCQGEQTEERDCLVPCASKEEKQGTYSNWTEWSVCQSPDCTTTRTRQCLQQPCSANLIESRSCSNSLCPNMQLNPSSNMNTIVYFSAALLGFVFFLLASICLLRYYRHQRRERRMNKKTMKTACVDCHTEKNEYPFYYSIQQDTNSTRSSTNSDSTDQQQFNQNYQKLLQTLPGNTDLRYFAVSILNHRGCRLEIPHTGVSLTIPEDAVLLEDEYLVYIALLYHDDHTPRLNSNQTRLSPIILIGPSDVTLLKPAVLTFEHTASIDASWQYHLMYTDDFLHWKSILTSGQENIATPVYLQFYQEHQALVLFETMGAYTLIGQSHLNYYASKYIQMACFYTDSTLRVRFFDRTSDAFERCLTEECAMNSHLCDQPKSFLCHDNQDPLCLNLDYELSSTSRIHIGYKEIPLDIFWNERFDRSCWIFPIPDLQFNLDLFAIHIDLYQATILDNALHTRLSIDRVRFSQRMAYNTLSLVHRQRTKSAEKTTKLSSVLRQQLCQILDPPNILGNDWRMLASHLLSINYLQYFATKTSPTEHLLTLWHARQEPLVNLLNVFNQIGRSDAACLVLANTTLNH